MWRNQGCKQEQRLEERLGSIVGDTNSAVGRSEGVKNQAGGVVVLVVVGGVGFISKAAPPCQLRWGGDKQTRRCLKSRQASFFSPPLSFPYLMTETGRGGAQSRWRRLGERGGVDSATRE